MQLIVHLTSGRTLKSGKIDADNTEDFVASLRRMTRSADGWELTVDFDERRSAVIPGRNIVWIEVIN